MTACKALATLCLTVPDTSLPLGARGRGARMCALQYSSAVDARMMPRSCGVLCCRGDIQLCYNHTMLHARSTYKDGPGKGEQRHLARLWVAPRNDRPLPEE